MKHNVLTYLSLLVILNFSGCYRYLDWAQSIVDQGCPLETCCCQVQPYIKSARVYDQFTTLGLFDALLLHDEVIQAYACAHKAKYNLSHNKYLKFLNNERDEHDSYISFYLLAVVPDDVPGTLLTDENSIWTVQLKLGNSYYNPVKIKIIELVPEYRYFFGKKLTGFKKQYLVQFNAYDDNSIPLISPLTRSIELVLRKVGVETTLCWPLNEQWNVLPECSIQDDTLAYDINTNLI